MQQAGVDIQYQDLRRSTVVLFLIETTQQCELAYGELDLLAGQFRNTALLRLERLAPRGGNHHPGLPADESPKGQEDPQPVL